MWFGACYLSETAGALNTKPIERSLVPKRRISNALIKHAATVFEAVI
jgi:hypothetical protein